MMATMKLNNELNGVEVYFDTKPIKDILTNLKDNGFRFSKRKMCWYAKQSDKTLKVAKEITNNRIESSTPKQKTNNKNISLFDRVQFKEGNTDKSKYNYKFVGSNYTGLDVKETAKEIRKHLKNRFKEVKFSVTSERGMSGSINVTIKQSPYNKESEELKHIIEYCNKLLSSYNYDDSDTMTDYFNTHFYKRISIDYDYIQVEQTEAVKNDIEDFKNRLEEQRKTEELRKKKEIEEWEKEQEKKAAEHKKFMQERKEQKEVVYNSVNVVPLEEQEQYFVIGSQFATLNKNSKLDQYIGEVENLRFNLEDVKIKKEVHFTDKKALEYFSNMLLEDFDFLTGTGGSYTDDQRINSMQDYRNMTELERNTVEWITEGVAIYYNNELQFIANAEGYSYARYVGLTNDVEIKKDYNSKETLTREEVEELKHKADIIEDTSFNVIVNNDLVTTWNVENWKQYKKLFKNELDKRNVEFNKAIIQQIDGDSEELKSAMYRVLTECDSMQDQFDDADIQQGQKLTICRLGAMGTIGISYITVEEVHHAEYAQYTDTIKLIFKQPKKKRLYKTYLYKDMLIYEGWHEIPNSLFYDVEQKTNMIVTRSKFLSCDKSQYNVIIDYMNNKNIKPIINTYKPVF